MARPMGARILIVDDSPTIRKVVASILERRDYETAVAADGVEALAVLAERPADLVLVDFVMPRMNGYQFCRELRLHERFKDVPVVLMSAKGDKIRGKFVEQTGALDAITKPFDARGLVAVIESALKKSAEGGRRPAGVEFTEEELSSRPSVELPSLQRISAAQALAEALGDLLVPELETLQGLNEETVRTVLRRAIDPEAVAELSSVLRTIDFGEQAGEALSGDLAVISISEILQVLDVQRQSGALTVTSKKAQVVLYIRNGDLDFASYTGLPEEFLLGRYLVDTGAITREALDRALAAREAGDGRVLGDYLVDSGAVSAEELTKALVQQTSELLYEVVRWRKGRFRFLYQAENAMAQQAQLGLPTGGLIMEGFRRVDEWRLIEDSFDFTDVLFRDEMAIERLMEQGKLTPQERAVLEHIDGENTVGEVVDAAVGSSFEVCKILYQLLNSRLVRRRAA
ncbi:MAG: response regulator [Myxococcales bacterium]|nr:response regulator [Myxococcales bacterium]